MQFRTWISFLIFIGSYLPLSLILLAQNYDYDAIDKSFCWAFWTSSCTIPFKNPWFAIGIFFLCVFCLALTLILLAYLKPYTPITVRSASHLPADLMNYSLPYVVSFMSIDYQDTGKFIGFLIFLVWMFWITHRSGQILLNPVLIAFGWRYYDITYSYGGEATERTGHALVHGFIAPDEIQNQLTVQELFIIKPAKRSGGN